MQIAGRGRAGRHWGEQLGVVTVIAAGVGPQSSAKPVLAEVLRDDAGMVWLFGGACRSEARLDGKVAVVTGASAGIGKETALELAARGARVILAVRDVNRGEAAAREMRQRLARRRKRRGDAAAAGQVVVEEVDLACLQSVRHFARRLLDGGQAIHILVNNAGVMATPKRRTKDGFDLQFGVNHLGHFLLTLLLLPRLRSSAAPLDPARVVVVSSVSYSWSRLDFDDLQYERGYSPMVAYARSKLANMLFARELARRLRDAQVGEVTSYCVHPGLVATDIVRHLDKTLAPGASFLVGRVGSLFVKTPKQGAQTSVHCAVDAGAAKESGLYYTDCAVTTPLAAGRDDGAARRLWECSAALVGLLDFDPLVAAETPRWALEPPTPTPPGGSQQDQEAAAEAADAAG